MLDYIAYDNKTMQCHTVYGWHSKYGLVTHVLLSCGIFPLHNFTYFEIYLN